MCTDGARYCRHLCWMASRKYARYQADERCDRHAGWQRPLYQWCCDWSECMSASIFHFGYSCGVYRWPAMAMLPIRSVNQMPIIQVNFVCVFYQFITIADSIVISFDTVAIHTFSCRRPAIYYRICKYHDWSVVPLHGQFASRWKCPCVSLVFGLFYSMLICLHK